MEKKFYKKVIARRPEDLSIISALCAEGKVRQSDIKYLKENKVFLLTLERKNKEDIYSQQNIASIIKFDFIEKCKSKNIDQKEPDNVLELFSLNIFKKNNNFEILLLFLNNRAITLSTEVIEVTMEYIKTINDENL